MRDLYIQKFCRNTAHTTRQVQKTRIVFYAPHLRQGFYPQPTARSAGSVALAQRKNKHRNIRKKCRYKQVFNAATIFSLHSIDVVERRRILIPTATSSVSYIIVIVIRIVKITVYAHYVNVICKRVFLFGYYP